MAAAAIGLLLTGCGGSSSVTSGFPPGQGPVIGGTVSMPNGVVAAAPSTLGRLAQALITRVEALVAGNVQPVASGVEVRLVQIGEGNIVGGAIQGGEVVFRGTTGDDGAYSVRLPSGTTPDTCRFYVEVGADRTLTRAFVYSERVDVDFQSEAALRLLLEQIGAGATSLCGLSSNDIRLVNEAVRASGGMVFGETAAAVNNSAQLVAAADPGVQNAIAIAVGAPTPGPPATDTVPPTSPATATVPVPTETAAPPTATRPATTRTNTRAPTNTSGPATRTATSTPLATDTVQPRTPTNTAAATNTSAPTNTPAATDTPVPTNTTETRNTPVDTTTPVATRTAIESETPVPTDTPVAPTNTVPAANTATATSTRVPTVPPTATAVGAAARLDVGIVSGTAGSTVTVPVTLTTHGAGIAAVSNEIEYDGATVKVAGSATAPDCSIDARLAATKQLHAQVSALAGTHHLLRVGIIGAANNDLISDGPVYTCRFTISADASGSLALLNTPDAAGPQAQAVAVEGSDGRIDVTAPPASLGLSAGTATAGGVGVVTASLSAQGRALAAVATDIHFDTAELSVDDASGPGCTIAAPIAALGKEIVVTEIAEAAPGKALLRIGLIGRDNNSALPDGSVALFQCRFVVQPGASGTIVLPHSPEAAAPDALPVALSGESGSITVQ